MVMNVIQDTVLGLLPAKRKRTDKWISFNAVCCSHTGESQDTRGRGGIINSPDGAVSYHCFNCNFKVSYRPGWHLSYKFRKLLRWLGADDNTVKRLTLEALRIKELVLPEEAPEPEREITFKPRPLPEHSVSLQEWATYARIADPDWQFPSNVVNAVDYLYKRKHELPHEYEFYLTDEKSYNLDKRIIVPFYWKHELIGYSARALTDDIKPKYHSSYEPNFVFNTDKQTHDAKFVIVVEGPFDAMAVDGVAVLSNECSEVQADIIDSLGKEVIVVPDFDTHIDKRGREQWPGVKLVDQAVEFGWNVSFPVWRETCKDVAEAVARYGQLFVLKAIIDGKETSRLKIELMKKKIHS